MSELNRILDLSDAIELINRLQDRLGQAASNDDKIGRAIASAGFFGAEDQSQADRIMMIGERYSLALADRDRLQLELDYARGEIEQLKTRQQELLQTCVRLTNEVPFQDEIKDWQIQRAKLVAEIGTLRAALSAKEGKR